jgi:hypothetical protein
VIPSLTHTDLAAVSASFLAASCTMAPGKKSQDVPDRCQPTLLSVPQELRDKIVRAYGMVEEHG